MKKAMEYVKKGITIILIIFAISLILFEQVREQTFLFVTGPFVYPLLDKMLEEDAERQRKIANGEEVEIIHGKDTIFEMGDLYCISKYGLDNDKVLMLHDTSPSSDVISRIYDYSFYNNSLYIVAYEGYAVIDKDDLCKVYITVPRDEFFEGKEYEVTSKGEKLFYSGKTESEYVVYLDSFSDYSKEEQDNLNKMIEKLKEDKGTVLLSRRQGDGSVVLINRTVN